MSSQIIQMHKVCSYYYLVHSYNMVDNVCWGSVLRLSNLDNVHRKFPIELIKVTISTRRCVSDIVSRMLLLQLFWLHVFQKMCFSFLINQRLQNSYIRKFPFPHDKLLKKNCFYYFHTKICFWYYSRMMKCWRKLVFPSNNLVPFSK